jgi:hypothetical protein
MLPVISEGVFGSAMLSAVKPAREALVADARSPRDRRVLFYNVIPARPISRVRMMNWIVRCVARVLLAVLWLWPGIVSAQVNVQQVVDQFYPTDRLSPEDRASRRSCFAVYSVAANGAPDLIIAGYTDMISAAALAITRNADGGYQVASKVPQEYDMFGNECTVELIDVDFDGRREIHLLFSGVRMSDAWLFKWDGLGMTNMTPTQLISGTRFSEICGNSPIDLTHTGPLKIVCSNISGSTAVDEADERPMDVYELTGPTYQIASHLLTVRPFEIRGNPGPQFAYFRKVVDSTGPYILRVINGDRTGSNRVSSGTITLNNVIIVEPSQLSAGTEFIEISIESLPILNVLKAELGGTDGAKILITVTDSTARQ